MKKNSPIVFSDLIAKNVFPTLKKEAMDFIKLLEIAEKKLERIKSLSNEIFKK